MNTAPLSHTWTTTLDQFDIYQRAAGLRPKTLANRRDSLTLLASRSGRELADISRGDLLEMLTRANPRTGVEISPGTKASERSTYQVFFAWAKEEKLRKGDPAKALPKVKIPRRKPRPLRQAQIEDILRCGIYKRTRDIVTIAALSGLRLGEIVKIRGEEYDPRSGTLRTIRKGGLEQIIVLHPLLVELAREYPPRGWWFPSPAKNREFPAGGGHILMRSASDRISIAIGKAGITDTRLTAHSLRHFFATILLAEGVSIRVVQEMLGHASLATTQMYTEVTEAQEYAAVVKLPRIERPTSAARMAA